MSDYDLLGLQPGASIQDAKRARNRLVRTLHPDRPENQGADPSQLAEINAAFDRIIAGAPKLSEAAKSAQPRSKAWQDFKDFDAKPGPGARTTEEGRDTNQNRREENPSGTGQHRQEQERRDSRQGQAYEKAGGFGASDRAAQNFYAKARAHGVSREEELRRKAQERAARETAAAPGDVRSERPGAAFVASSDRREQMREAIEKRKKQEAYRRVTQLRGIYPDPRKPIDTNRGDLPGFHMAEHIRFEGRTMQLHLATEAKEGRNIIAMPEVEMVDGRTVRQGRGVSLFEISSSSGAGARPVQSERNPVAGASGLAVEVIFGSELAKRRDRSEGERA